MCSKDHGDDDMDMETLEHVRWGNKGVFGGRLHFLSGLETSKDSRPWGQMGLGDLGWRSLEMWTKEKSIYRLG